MLETTEIEPKTTKNSKKPTAGFVALKPGLGKHFIIIIVTEKLKQQKIQKSLKSGLPFQNLDN